MPAVGQKVMLHAKGGYYPYAWCGVVQEVIGPDCYVLSGASLIPHTLVQGSTWLGIAAGNTEMREGMRVRKATNPVEVYGVAFCTEWVGDLPTKDQN